jgi:hypothetical protein
MLDYFFYLIGLICLVCLGLGFSRKSFAFSILGVTLLLLLGITLQAEGLDRAEGKTITINSDATLITTELKYVNYTTVNSTWVWILSNMAFLGGIALIGGMGVIAVKRAWSGL